MENELIKRAKSGDKDAFAALYTAYKDKLYRYAYFKLNDPDDAMDAVSSCITEAYLGIATLKSEKAFSVWIFKILYRQCCAILKNRSANAGTLNIYEINLEAPDTAIQATELKQALSILYEDEKGIVLLSVVAGYTSKEIAEMLGLKASTVRSKQSRALAKMRKFLE